MMERAIEFGCAARWLLQSGMPAPSRRTGYPPGASYLDRRRADRASFPNRSDSGSGPRGCRATHGSTPPCVPGTGLGKLLGPCRCQCGPRARAARRRRLAGSLPPRRWPCTPHVRPPPRRRKTLRPSSNIRWSDPLPGSREPCWSGTGSILAQRYMFGCYFTGGTVCICFHDFSFSRQISSINSVSSLRPSFIITVHGRVYTLGSSTVISTWSVP